MAYDLETMKLQKADLYIFAGDFNFDKKHYPRGFKYLQDQEYTTDQLTSYTTIFDLNLNAKAALDHVFAKSGSGREVLVSEQKIFRKGYEVALDRKSVV